MLRIGKKVLKNGLHNDERTVARLTKAQHRYQAGLLSLSDTQRALPQGRVQGCRHQRDGQAKDEDRLKATSAFRPTPP